MIFREHPDWPHVLAALPGAIAREDVDPVDRELLDAMVHMSLGAIGGTTIPDAATEQRWDEPRVRRVVAGVIDVAWNRLGKLMRGIDECLDVAMAAAGVEGQIPEGQFEKVMAGAAAHGVSGELFERILRASMERDEPLPGSD